MNSENLSYFQLNELLREFSKNPCINFESVGKTAENNDIFCVTISENPIKYGKSFCEQQYRELVEEKKGFNGWYKGNRKIPIILTGSIHGNEPVGLQAILKLLETFCDDNNPEVKELLSHLIIICVVCVNPDGFNAEKRFNKNGFDLNRDFIFQTQPETKAVVNIIQACNPVALFDLHGYVSQDKRKLGIIEPCTIPHNPNYEYDLYIKSAFPLVMAMEQFLLNNKEKFSSQRYKSMDSVCIPYRDMKTGWDDYPPFSTAMYAMLHGAIGCTVEAPTKEKDGTLWVFNAIIGACEYIVSKRKTLLYNYFLFLKRGVTNTHPYHPKAFFPSAYVLPKTIKASPSLDKLVSHLLDNGINVEKTVGIQKINDRIIPTGSFVVFLNQPKAILANTFLWKGDHHFSVKMTELCAWNMPLLWGVESIPINGRLSIQTKGVKNTDSPGIVGRKKGIKTKKIGIIYDGGLYNKQSHSGLKACLSLLGYSFKEIHPRDLTRSESLNDIDVLIYNGFEHLFYLKDQFKPVYQKYVLETKDQQKECRETLRLFLEHGGRFIAIGAGAAKVTKRVFRLTDVTLNISGWNDNGIVEVDYSKNPITNGYDSKGIGFVFRPIWFSDTGNVEIVASYSADQDSFIAGYWSEHHKAKGYPVIIKEKSLDVILIGLEICHRAQPEYLYKLLVNAIDAEYNA